MIAVPPGSGPDLQAVYAARRRIAGLARATPLVRSDWLSALAGGAVHLKLESLQTTGSFKLRGALNAALVLREALADSEPVLVTASAGNAGKALAYAARRLGFGAIVFTPRNAPRAKLDGIRRLGAELRAEAATYEESEILAKAYAAEQGLRFVSPYSHPDVIAGAGTVGLEIVEELPEVDVIVVPLGGGGLLSGVAVAAKGVSARIEVIGVEIEASQPFSASLAEGRIVEVEVGPTLADGLAGNMDPETITFDLVRRLVDRVVVAREDDLAAAVRGLAAHEHLIAEGAGAVGVAALIGDRLNLRGRTAAVVVSGSNIDLDRLASILGMA